MTLDDKAIRMALIDFLNKRVPTPNAVIEELRVHNGNAIADVVAVYESSHCFEIKGENDTISRILRQAEYYNTTFTKITLVTTPNHIFNATKLAPEFWGILLAKASEGKVVFKYQRKARYNTNINKSLALSILWRSELLDIAHAIDLNGLKKRLSRAELADFIANNKKTDGVVSDITLSILNRYKPPIS